MKNCGRKKYNKSDCGHNFGHKPPGSILRKKLGFLKNVSTLYPQGFSDTSQNKKKALKIYVWALLFGGASRLWARSRFGSDDPQDRHSPPNRSVPLPGMNSRFRVLTTTYSMYKPYNSSCSNVLLPSFWEQPPETGCFEKWQTKR